MATPDTNNPIEAGIPIVKYNGGIYSALPIQTTSDLTVGGDLNVTGDIVVDDVTLDALTVTGNTILGNAVSDTLTVTGATTIHSTAALAFAVGAVAAGATPVFSIDAATSSAVAGLKITGAATGGTVAVVTTDSGSNTNLTINAKGTGTIGIGSVSTGAVTITPATTVTGVLTATAGVTSPAGVATRSATAVPASAGALAAGAGFSMFSTPISLWVTSDTPAFSAQKGDICINTAGSSSSTRLYINNGTTNWVAISTAS